MTLKQNGPGEGRISRRAGESFSRQSSISEFKPTPRYGQVIALPLPRDVVRIAGRPCRLSPGLRARIRAMVEGRP